MARNDAVHARVTRLLAEWFDLDEVVRDRDGDYPFRFGTAGYYIQIVDREPALVRVFGAAAYDVPRTAGLLGELNDINTSAIFVRAAWCRGRVWVESELWADTLDAFSLGMACERVGELADRIGPSIAAVYGGRTRWALSDPEGELPQAG